MKTDHILIGVAVLSALVVLNSRTAVAQQPAASQAPVKPFPFSDQWFLQLFK